VILYYLLVSVMPMILHPLWSSLLGDFTLVKYLGFACFGYAVLYLFVRDGMPSFLSSWQGRLFVVLAILGMTSSLLFGVRLPFEVSPFMSYLSFLMLCFTTLVVIDSMKRLRWVLLTAIGSVAYASLHVIREWQKYGGMAAGYRPGYVTGDPNYFSVSSLLCIPLAIFLIGRTGQPRWERRFCIGSIVITVIAMALAASRGGFLGLTAAALFMVWRSKERKRNLVWITVIILPLMLVTPASPLKRLLSPDQGDQYAADERLLLTEAGINMVRQHPWTGVGAGNFKAFVREFGDVNEEHVAHNTYVSVAAELGLPGFFLFLGVAIATMITLERVRRSTKEDGPELIHRAACGMQVGFIAYFIAVFFVTSETHKLYWMMVFISMLLPQLQEAAYRKRREATARLARRRPPVRRGLAPS
jgi:putative inorganic carbon (HCO3(-)) transporter